MNESWVSVAEFSDPASARVASGRLSSENIPNAVSRPPFSAGLYYLRVPPELSDAAREALVVGANISDSDLASLALQSPPPDDLLTREPGSATSGPRSNRIPWMVAVGVGIVFVLSAIIAYRSNMVSYEVLRKGSPDGKTEAILLEVPRDAAGAHSYKVCLQRGAGGRVTATSCREIAYLAGVTSIGTTRPVDLVWKDASRLEIHYGSAVSVHMYQRVVVWGSTRSTGSLSIFTSAVRMGYPISTQGSPAH
jgi:hypothetical protein